MSQMTYGRTGECLARRCHIRRLLRLLPRGRLGGAGRQETKENPHGCHGRKVSGRHRDPAAHWGDPPGGSRRPACRRSRATGRMSTTGASARRDWTRYRTSSPRSMGLTSTSSTFARSMKMRCADRHARMARLDHRAAEDHRSPDQSDGAGRECSRRFSSRDSVEAGVWVLRQADHHRLGPRAYRKRLDRADEAPWVGTCRRGTASCSGHCSG
jgi:hypothetical protein